MKRPLYKRLYFQVCVAIVLGIWLGSSYKDVAIQLKPLGTGFIHLIKMLVGPIIFCTIVSGISRMGNMKEVGRVGGKALIYFEVVSTLALLIGLIAANLFQPGIGVIEEASLAPSAEQFNSVQALPSGSNAATFILNIIPHTIVSAFTEADAILQVLLVSILFGVSLAQFSEHNKLLIKILDQVSHVLFGMIGIVMKLAPIGAFGMITACIGDKGLGVLWPLGKLFLVVLGTCSFFVVVVLGSILKFSQISLWKFLRYLKEEIILVLATSSSETALPRLIAKLENLGCPKTIVGLVVPTGYSFNLDGTSIYLTIASVFVAQVGGVDLSILEQLSLLGVLMLTSKGAAGVTGSGLITLYSTVKAVNTIPVTGLSLITGIDIFLSEIRAVTNLIGNAVATVVVSKWENAFDANRAERVLNGEADEITEAPEELIMEKEVQELSAHTRAEAKELINEGLNERNL